MNAWVLPNAASALLLAFLTLRIVRRPPAAPIWPVLGVVFVAGTVYAAGDVLAMLAPGAAVPALVCIYGGAWLFTTGWLVFALRFAEAQGRPFGWARPPVLHGLYAWVGLIALSFATNPWHGLFLELDPGPRNHLGPLFWVHAATAHGCVLAALGIFATLARRGDGQAREQAIWLTAATVIPAAANMTFISIDRVLPFDVTVSAIGIACGVCLIGIRRTGLFGLPPVALRRALEADPDGLVLLDQRDRVVWTSPRASELLDPEALRPGSAFHAALAGCLRDPEDADKRLQAEALPRRIEEAGGVGVVFESTRDPGSWLRISASPLWRGDRRCGCWLRLREESALQRALGELREHASLRQAILAGSEELVIATDGAGRIRYHNERLPEMATGYRELLEQGAAQRLSEVFVPFLEDPQGHQALLAELRADPTLERVQDLRMRHGRVLQLHTHPFDLADGSPGRVWRVRDVTEQRHSEETLREAQRAESLGTMAGVVAHDFNNLLVGMLGNAELAAASLPEGHASRLALEDITHAAERAGELTRQLLVYAGRARVEACAIDLSESVREATELIGVAVTRHAKLECKLPSDLPAVLGDSVQLQQLAMNLLVNAAEALEDAGGGTIRVETGAVAAEAVAELAGTGLSGTLVFLSVEDDGPGIDAVTRERIFEPFFSTKYEGRGLGLAAVRGIAGSHGGRIRVDGRPGRGARFTAYLPASSQARPAPLPPQPKRRWRGEGTVLVVDDDAGVRDVAARILGSAGLEVLCASSGDEGIERVRTHRELGLVLLDLSMPGRDGWDTLRVLREIDPGLPVILSSGFPEEALDAPQPERFVQKPYRVHTLLDAVQAALRPPPGSCVSGEPH